MYYKNILEYFEQHCKEDPHKTVCEDDRVSYSYEEAYFRSRQIASSILKEGNKGAVGILLDQSADAFVSMLGTVYAGDYYTILDSKSVENRLKLIVDKLEPKCLITDKGHLSVAKAIYQGRILLIEEIGTDIDEKKLSDIRRRSIDTDPVYVLFTSGSTGVPKGTVVSHRSIISYATAVNETFHFNKDTVLGNQTPFYFSMSVLDVFCTITCGCTLVIIPKLYFTFVNKLINYLNERKIDTIYWVPSAYQIVSRLKVLEKVRPEYLKNCLFAGEPMRAKVLNYWRKYLPDCLYANLYGPTETTDTCTYWIADREVADDESVPIGIPFNNCDILVLDENNKEANKGELCVRGSFVAFGYYDDPQKTDSAFTLNPLNPNYREYIYRTGDIVEYDKNGDLLYISRKDYQIKHMGYRIELGEIETQLSAVDIIDACICLYDEKEDKIVVIYSGKEDDETIHRESENRLVRYMRPQTIIYLKQMPINANGKIDRALLKKKYTEGEFNG